MARKKSTQIEEVSISQFKATCLALLDKVKRTKKPILVLRKGEPIAQVIPPPPAPIPASWVGSFSGTGEIRGDIVAPASDSQEWDALRA